MKKKIIYIFLGIITSLVAVITVSDISVRMIANEHIVCDDGKIPHKKVGLLLGTGKYLSDGRINLFYKYRLDAAAHLYEAGAIKKILVSGDNSRKNYDEPREFKNNLLELGVKESDIYLDFAGFRTLDSIVRAKEVFGSDDFIIISQKSHIERALVLAKYKGITATGYAAKDVPVNLAPRMWVRERLARVKMWLDLVIGKQPKFLGETVEIK